MRILELSFVSPPYILDFVEVGIGKMPGNFDLDRIEAQQSKQFGKDWPDVRRLLEALMQIGIYYDANDIRIVSPSLASGVGSSTGRGTSKERIVVPQSFERRIVQVIGQAAGATALPFHKHSRFFILHRQ